MSKQIISTPQDVYDYDIIQCLRDEVLEYNLEKNLDVYKFGIRDIYGSGGKVVVDYYGAPSSQVYKLTLELLNDLRE